MSDSDMQVMSAEFASLDFVEQPVQMTEQPPGPSVYYDEMPAGALDASFSSLTDLLWCHEKMEHSIEPQGLQVSLVKGQCYLMLPEAFLECADHMSSEDWTLLCELGLQAADYDMAQCEMPVA